MEKTFTFLEGFGDTGQGDAFQAADGTVAPGAEVMSACVAFRLETFDVSSELSPLTKFIAGNLAPGALTGWGLVLDADPFWIIGGGGGAFVDFESIKKPVGGHLMVVHMTCRQVPAADPIQRYYFNGQVILEEQEAMTFGGGIFAVGMNNDPVVPAGTFDPFGASSVLPSARNGVTGVAYSEVTMSDADVAEHWRQILETEDMADGDFGWINLWSARRGLPDLALAGGVNATWVDEIGGAVLTRTLINGQTPTMQVNSRAASPY